MLGAFSLKCPVMPWRRNNTQRGLGGLWGSVREDASAEQDLSTLPLVLWWGQAGRVVVNAGGSRQWWKQCSAACGTNWLIAFRMPPALLLPTEDKCLYAKWILYLQTYFSALLACSQCLLWTWSVSISLTCHFCLKEGLEREGSGQRMCCRLQ